MEPEVTHRIPVYVVDGERIDMPDKRPAVIVESTWPNRDSVVLAIDGHRYTVIGADLKKAIDNCLNTTR